jgi:hypothetical protein
MNTVVAAPLLTVALLLLLLLATCSAAAVNYANHVLSELPPDQLSETEWMLVYHALNNTAAAAGKHDLSAGRAVEEGARLYCAIAAAQRWRTVPFEKCGRMVSALSSAFARGDVLGLTFNTRVMKFCVLGRCKTHEGGVRSEMRLGDEGAGTPVTYHRAAQRVR